jgi:hypothetical protein
MELILGLLTYNILNIKYTFTVIFVKSVKIGFFIIILHPKGGNYLLCVHVATSLFDVCLTLFVRKFIHVG